MNDPLILIPGLMCDARAFLPQIMTLCKGRTITIALPTPGATVEEISTRILDGAPQKFVLVGQGLGGDVALDLVRRAADRVTRIALLSTDPLAEAPQIAAAREARMVAARAGRLAEAMAEEVPLSSLAEGPQRQDVYATLQAMAQDLGPEVFIAQSRAMQRRPDQQKTLRRAMLPALILAGEDDRLVPLRRQELVAGLMPFAKLVTIPGAGHMAPLEQPQAVTEALEEFLAGPLLLR
jgi:pimeloyl-ACP methyl ester carboxylesterase